TELLGRVASGIICANTLLFNAEKLSIDKVLIASLFGFWWLEEDGGIEPLQHRCRTTVFKTDCRPLGGIFLKVRFPLAN
ncbi:MAG: hypothetical protein F6K10_39250, partial [Moorea sp. SIO2B7]|nr:hypothetical protein [Moorena sp. SIO2B7]